MIFKEPALLLLFVLIPLLNKVLRRAHRLREESAAKLRGEKSNSNTGKHAILFQLSSFAALILALAQPAWNPHSGPAAMQGRDLVIALDISRSMLARDVFPSRLDASKIAIFEGLEHLRGQRLGLITFAGAASVRVPLTLDHNFVRYMLDRAQPSDADVGSTSLQSAIEKAIDIVLKESKQGQQDLLILTDGEDYLSNIETTAQELKDCGARVLIIGLGDPLAGAQIPVGSTTNDWVRDKDGEIVTTRLDELKLNQLTEESPNVTYYAAQTRPFDLVAIYRKMLQETQNIVSGDEEGQLIYTEGYPLLIALALLLWLLPLSKRFFPLFAALLISSCGADPSHYEAVTEQVDRCRVLWAEAQTAIDADPRATVLQLESTRDELLLAAMKYPQDMRIAQQIAGISQQINIVEKEVEKQEQAEEDLQQKLAEAIEQLKILTQRETTLSQQSQRLLKKRPPTSPAEKSAAAPPALIEQTEIGQGTEAVLEVITQVQAVIQRMLKMAYGGDGTTPPTEFDMVVSKLTNAQSEQKQAIQTLQPTQLSWPQANSSLLSAAHRMTEALALLSDQSQGDHAEQDAEEGDESDWEFEEDMEWSESDMPSDMSMPMQSGNFKAALENQTLPTPNYTAEEILTEEAANMEQRAQQKSERAGAKVEKNW